MSDDAPTRREYDKLVRDRIPELIRANGETPVTETVEGAAYRDRLAAKLVEEAREFDADRTDAELADVLAVLEAICTERGTDLADLRELDAEKRTERGGFEGGVVLLAVEDEA